RPPRPDAYPNNMSQVLAANNLRDYTTLSFSPENYFLTQPTEASSLGDRPAFNGPVPALAFVPLPDGEFILASRELQTGSLTRARARTARHRRTACSHRLLPRGTKRRPFRPSRSSSRQHRMGHPLFHSLGRRSQHRL